MPWQTPAPFTGYYTPPPVDIGPPAAFFIAAKENPKGEEAKAIAQQIEYNKTHKSKGTILQQAVAPVTNVLAKVEDIVKKEVLPNPIFQIAMAYYMPGIASSLGPYLTAVPAAYQTAVATALASTALQVAQGVPFEDALKSATVNAITNTGAPKVADYILPYAGSPQVADALTSIGTSAAKTAAMGGSKDDIERNMLAGLTGSALTSSLQGVDVSRDTSRVAGAAAGGAVLGGTTGAIGGAASELGGQASRDEAAKNKALEDAKKGIASADTGTVSDSGQQLGEVVVTGKKETDPTVQDTNIILSDGSIKPKTTIPSLGTTTDTSPKEPTAVQDTVKATPETDASSQEGKPPVDEQGRYKPNLFIYGGTSPSTLGASLGTQAPFYPVAGTTGGLTSTRGAGEIESKETGKKRKNVWNEASLRLKDALGV